MYGRRLWLSGVVLAALVVAQTLATAHANAPQFFRIGTGGVGGTYFPVGGVIANAISAPPGARPCDKGGHCGVENLVAIAYSTNASVSNNLAVQNHDLEAGFAAADVTRSMYLGTEDFAGDPHPLLRVVANLYPEDLHLVLPRGSAIDSLDDLAGKRVGIGKAGSGTQVSALMLLEAWGIGRDDMQELELDNQQSAAALAAGELDAYFYIAGWPVAAMADLARNSGMELYSFKPEEIARIKDVMPSFVSSRIPANVYAGVDEAINTVAVSALLVMSADTDAELVYQVTKALWNDKTAKLLREGHVKARQVTRDTALKGLDELGVPLHEGAERYYREANLMAAQDD